ncbi:MAG: sodium:calcium antiporter [Candidatus Hodarchaeales archaeon]|jgi:Ca2+/Na+ antiporter
MVFKPRDYIEFIIFLALVVIFYFTREILFIDSLEIFSFGIIVGLFLAIRASERAVEGVDSAAKKLGITIYVAGVLSSLASNAPELVIGFFSVIRGNAEFAVAMIVIATGFNILLLGILIVMVTYKDEDGKMDVPTELLEVEVPVMRGAIIMLGGLFVIGIATVSFLGDKPDEASLPYLPSYAALLMVITYLAYLFFIIRYKGGKKSKKEVEESHGKKHHEFTKRQTIILLTVGFTGILFAGEMISQSAEAVGFGFGLTEFQLAFIVGACAALPEHAIALIAANREGGAELGLGNTIAGAMQNLLLMIGFVGLFTVLINPLGIPLVHVSADGHVIPFILIQLGFGALLVFLIKSSITDDKQLSLYEGLVIIIAQIFVFIIFLSGMHWI